MDELILENFQLLPDGNVKTIGIYSGKNHVVIKERIITPKDVCILERILEDTYLTREIEFYPDTGKIKSVCKFNKLGKVEGEYLEFYPSGNMKQKSYYINGKPSGNWLLFADRDMVDIIGKRYYISGRFIVGNVPIEIGN